MEPRKKAGTIGPCKGGFTFFRKNAEWYGGAIFLLMMTRDHKLRGIVNQMYERYHHDVVKFTTGYSSSSFKY
jgi:hypothetical protein